MGFRVKQVSLRMENMARFCLPKLTKYLNQILPSSHQMLRSEDKHSHRHLDSLSIESQRIHSMKLLSRLRNLNQGLQGRHLLT